MVTVRKLISELKQMPQNLEVGVAMSDNSENEVAGWVCSVMETTDDVEERYGEVKKGDRCVVLRC